jgi:hypothetical protein
LAVIGSDDIWALGRAHVVAVSPDGTKVFLTGWTYGAATKGDYVTIAYSA